MKDARPLRPVPSALLGLAVTLMSVPLVAGTGAGRTAFAATTLTEATTEAGPAQIGEHRPALEVETVDAGLVTDARVAGRVVIVDFFATWCGPCHSALADLLAARAANPAAIALVLVDLGEPTETVRRWIAQAGLPADVLVALDPSGAAFRRWGARKLPTTFVVDASGVVRHINRGWGGGYRERMARWLHDLATAEPVPTRPDDHARAKPAKAGLDRGPH